MLVQIAPSIFLVEGEKEGRFPFSHSILIQDKVRRLEEIVDQALIYSSFPYVPALLRYWERQMIQKHLNRLIRKGLVRERDGVYVPAERTGGHPWPRALSKD
jgi:hypothetical protein